MPQSSRKRRNKPPYAVIPQTQPGSKWPWWLLAVAGLILLLPSLWLVSSAFHLTNDDRAIGVDDDGSPAATTLPVTQHGGPFRLEGTAGAPQLSTPKQTRLPRIPTAAAPPTTQQIEFDEPLSEG